MKIREIHFTSSLIFLFVFILCGISFAGENPTNASQDPSAPWEKDEQTHPILYPVKLFNTYISGADGNRCPMYPSCSQYCIEAFKIRGLFMGWIMSCDRLLRCGRDEVTISAPIWIDGEKRINDPVSNNDILR